jgi:ABC-2 type transport system permease protein
MRALAPYRAAFASRFLLVMQYRSAAIAGFVTQCWWGGLKVMILATFYGASAVSAAAPITLSQAITYIWLSQALLALLPWAGDPEVSAAVRSGAVTYDRLRPVDAYAFWFVRSAGWMAARVVPRAAMMFLFTGVALPVFGLVEWGWQPPADVAALLGFGSSVLLALLLSSAMIMLINIITLVTLTDRGANAISLPLVVALSGSLLPLGLFPDELQTVLLMQPFAGLLDIPLRIYTGNLVGAEAIGGIGLQLFWIVAVIALGRIAMARALRRLEVQGG